MVVMKFDVRHQAEHGERARAPLIARRLTRFHPNYRARVTALAERHSRLSDLAVSFPALLFALAVPRFGIDTEAAVGAVIDGRPLSRVAPRVGVPMWIRKLPPEGLSSPLPLLPDGEMLRRQIVNHLPRSPKRLPVWLDAIAAAAACGNEPIAVWIAREVTALPSTPPAVDLRELRLVVLWAWFSGQSGTLGRELIASPWLPSMKFKTAHAAARAWLNLVELHLLLSDKPVTDNWFEPAVINGYAFVPLMTAHEIAAEANRMENCLVTYGGLISSNQSRIWSVRRNGDAVATIEVGLRNRRRRDTFVGVQQIRGLRNRPVADEVFDVIAQWQMRQDLRIGPCAPMRTESELHQTWIAMWRPYWIAKRRIPGWLPLARRLGSLW